jgi:hypothetical protein
VKRPKRINYLKELKKIMASPVGDVIRKINEAILHDRK